MNQSFKFLLLAALIGFSQANTCALTDSDKVDCGFTGVTQSSCESKGCCWSQNVDNSVAPWCYYSASSPSGYSLSSISETSTGYSGTLNLISSSGAYGSSISTLKLDVIYETSDIIRVKITDPTKARWEIPESIVPRPHASSKPSSMNVKFTYTSNPFSFKVTRKSDGATILDFNSALAYKDQYIEVRVDTDASAKTYGLGESTRTQQALTVGSTHTLWAADIPAAVMNVNLYGSYPYYLQLLKGAAHGAMMFNSNGMDIGVLPSAINFKMIGGIIDLYSFAGPSPADVVSQYTSIVGRPMMMPYWSLGFHNCKYGYSSVYQVEEIVANYSAAGIPLDTQWMDIDYMQNYRDFTYDSKNFPTAEVNSFVNKLHSNGQHFVPIVDPGIMVYSGYSAYDTGMTDQLFVKDINGGYYLGQVWPGPTYFPDFTNPKAQDYWTTQMQNFYKLAPVDGIWIDMNEVSNFCNGDGRGQSCANTQSGGCPAPGGSQTSCCLSCTTKDPSNKYDFPPYNIHNAQGLVSAKTMAMSATHYNNVPVYNMHNLYGLTEQIATNNAMATIRGKRPFVLSRSSFMSTGVHSAKWTGDNAATWNDLKSSIVSIMDFNLFGVPMIGADICGFLDNTTEELCARWIEVGAFYPFSRDHNTLGAEPQELYLWPTVTQAAKTALAWRYQMLPYMYSLFYQAHASGGTVARSLWFNFPTDTTASTIDTQFMLGSAIMVSPVLTQGATSVNAYFAKGLWYSFSDFALAVDASNGGVTKTLNTPLTSTNVHIYGSQVVPLQQAAMTTTAGRQTPFTLVAALCTKGQAKGSLFWDDGEQINIDKYLSVNYAAAATSATTGSFTSTVVKNTYSEASSNVVQTIVITGKGLALPASATLNGATLSASQIVFDSSKSIITFQNLNLKLNEAINLTWI